MYFPLFVGALCLWFASLNVCITLCPFLFCNHLEEEERELAALLLLSYGCLGPVDVL